MTKEEIMARHNIVIERMRDVIVTARQLGIGAVATSDLMLTVAAAIHKVYGSGRDDFMDLAGLCYDESRISDSPSHLN